jgi:hypothetical protein
VQPAINPTTGALQTFVITIKPYQLLLPVVQRN